MPLEDDVYGKLRLELRRGSLVLAVLAALKSERYGYTLRKVLADAGLTIDEGALYPMLRRLEDQGVLTSEWREEDKRNKRFYRLSRDGAALLSELIAEWRAINGALNNLIKKA
jgi:PadR family transcriptional regulator, regulatory protein PadR